MLGMRRTRSSAWAWQSQIWTRCPWKAQPPAWGPCQATPPALQAATPASGGFLRAQRNGGLATAGLLHSCNCWLCQALLCPPERGSKLSARPLPGALQLATDGQASDCCSFIYQQHLSLQELLASEPCSLDCRSEAASSLSSLLPPSASRLATDGDTSTRYGTSVASESASALAAGSEDGHPHHLGQLHRIASSETAEQASEVEVRQPWSLQASLVQWGRQAGSSTISPSWPGPNEQPHYLL